MGTVKENKPLCIAKTRNGQPCKRHPLKEQDYCWQHTPTIRRWIKRIELGGIGIVVLAVIGLFADLIGIGLVKPLNPDAARPIGGPTASLTSNNPDNTTSDHTPEAQASITFQPTPIFISPSDEMWRDDFSKNSSGWDIISETYGSSGYEIGKYYIKLKNDRLFLALWETPGQIDNGVLQVDVVSPYNENGYEQGIGFGWHKNWEESTYAFTINSTGSCAYWEINDGKSWRLKSRTENVSGYYNQKKFHTLRLYIRNSQVTGYIDDMYCGEYILPNYKLGYVGLVARPDNTNGEGIYYFDEFRIFRIP